MTVSHAVRTKGPAHARAVRRLGSAREEEARLGDLCARAAGARTGPLARFRLSESRAKVASREQSLHWIKERESLEPWADGEWAPQIETGLGMPRTGHVGQEMRSIHGRASRTRVELAQEVSRSAKRVKALRRATEVATARRKEQGSRNV
jgi:hypothetical protein